MNLKLREPVNSLTHYFGALIFFIGTILMLIKVTILHEGIRYFISALVFGISLIALYFTSGFFHMINVSEEKIEFWNKIDHSMIFILIAGSYTPFCLIGLPDKKGDLLLILVWIIAIFGCLLMTVRTKIPTWFNTALYIAMGWLAILNLKSFIQYLPHPAFFLMVLGGIFYTIGGVIFEVEKPNISEHFQSHEFFHIFCLLGSICHFCAVYFYLL